MGRAVSKTELVEKVAKRLKCIHCRRRYRVQDLAVMNQWRNIAALRLACAMCDRQRVVFAVVKTRIIRVLYSELEPEEWTHFSQSPPVTADRVIEMHEELREYDGDFGDVQEEPLPAESP